MSASRTTGSIPKLNLGSPSPKKKSKRKKAKKEEDVADTSGAEEEAAAAELAANKIAAKNLDYSFDKGNWSPQYMLDHKSIFFHPTPSLEADDSRKSKKERKKAAPAPKKNKPGKKGAKQAVLADEPPKLDQAEYLHPGMDLEVVKRRPDGTGPWNLDGFATAVTYLQQALDGAFAQQQIDVISRAALGIAKALGTRDPVLTAQYLHLHMSAQVCLEGRAMFKAAAAPTCPERLAMERRDAIMSKLSSYTGDPEMAPALAVVERYLERHSIAWQLTSLPHLSSEPLEEGQKRCDQDFDIMKESLPGSVFVLSMLFSPEDHCLYLSFICRVSQYTRVARVSLSTEQEQELILLGVRMEDWRIALERTILNYGHDSTQMDGIEQQHRAIVEDTIRILEPCWIQLCLTADFLSGRGVCLITDSFLFSLPLEALPIFSETQFVSRELSLRFIHNRTRRYALQKAVPVESRKDMGYILDPFEDDKDGRFWARMEQLIDRKDRKCEGVKGRDARPNQEDWQNNLTNRGVFAFLGYESFMSQITPGLVCSTLCAGLSLVHLADHSLCETSYRRQSKQENRKSQAERVLARPYNTALLLSLRGVSCVLLNQHAIAVSTSARFFAEFWDHASGERPVADALHAVTHSEEMKRRFGHGTFVGVGPGKGKKKKRGKDVKTQDEVADAASAGAAQVRYFDLWNGLLVGLPWIQGF